MKFAKIAACFVVAMTAFGAQAQHRVVCTPHGIDRGAGVVQFTGKKTIVDTGAFTLKTETEVFKGDGRENINSRGEKWYGYGNPKNGDQAVVVFGNDGVMTLIVAMSNVTLYTTCVKI